MPELPEVETVRRGLHELIIGRKVKTVEHDTAKSFPNAVADVEQFLVNSKIIDVRRRAKVLLIDLSTQYTLVIHLKMTGQLVFVSPSTNYHLPTTSEPEVRFGAGHPTDSLIGELPDRSTRVTFTFEDGSRLYFNDQRKFGWVKLLPTPLIQMALTGSVFGVNARKQRSMEQTVRKVPSASTGAAAAAVTQEFSQTTERGLVAGESGTDAVIDFMRKVGPEPLDAEFTAEQFAERFKRRARSPIKVALLDQTVVAGVGNIYADESLWGAKIHPQTKVADLPRSAFSVLHSELCSVMNEAIKKGGSTDRNYVNAEGKKGSYIDFARAFRQEGKPCPRCSTTIIKFKVAGRGTHICPQCQVLE